MEKGGKQTISNTSNVNIVSSMAFSSSSSSTSSTSGTPSPASPMPFLAHRFWHIFFHTYISSPLPPPFPHFSSIWRSHKCHFTDMPLTLLMPASHDNPTGSVAQLMIVYDKGWCSVKLIYLTILKDWLRQTRYQRLKTSRTWLVDFIGLTQVLYYLSISTIHLVLLWLPLAPFSMPNIKLHELSAYFPDLLNLISCYEWLTLDPSVSPPKNLVVLPSSHP